MMPKKKNDHATLGVVEVYEAEGTGLEPATPLLGHHISSWTGRASIILQHARSRTRLSSCGRVEIPPSFRLPANVRCPGYILATWSRHSQKWRAVTWA